MKRNLPTSILQLTLIGFAIVVLPLIVALVSTFVQVDRLAEHMKSAVFNAAQAVSSSRVIVSQVLAMERSARQFLVLKDQAVLARYEMQRMKLGQAVDSLSGLKLDPATRGRLELLTEHEQQLSDGLALVATKPQNGKNAKKALPEFIDLVRAIPFEVSQMIARDANSVSREVNQVKRTLLTQAMLLIPLVLVMAGVFSILITRPLKHLGVAIRRLGTGEFSAPIHVTGSQDIRDLGDRLEWLRVRLSELEQQKLMFLRHVSHELKTPLTALREGTELLNDEVVGTLNAEQREVTHILRDNSVQLQKQIEALLKFDLALSENGLAEREWINLRVVFEQVVEKQKLALRARGIRAEKALENIEVFGGREQLRVLLDNLVSNAIKYSPDNSTVELSLRAENGRARIDVIDQGPGIKANERSRVFEAFYQGSRAPKGHIKGTGLGLAIADRYVKLHGGSIEIVESSKGGHFRVLLPISPSDKDV